MLDVSGGGDETDMAIRKGVSHVELEDRLRFETLISDLSARMVAACSEELDREIGEGLETIRRFFRCDRCGLLVVDPKDKKVYPRFARYAEGVENAPAEVDAGQFFPWAFNKVTLSGKPVTFGSLEELPPEAERDREAFRLEGVKSGMVIPIFQGSEVKYIMVAQTTHEEREWPDIYLPRLRLLGEVFANAVEQRRTLDVLRRSEARMSLAAEAAGTGFWALDPASGNFWASTKARALFEFDPESEITVDAFLDRVHAQDRERVSGAIRKALQHGRNVNVEYRTLRDGGEVRWIRSQGRPEVGPSGEVNRLMGVSMDVTHQKRADDEANRLRLELAHVARVAIMGEITTAVAHELSQPLTAILSNAQVAQRMLSRESPDLAELREIITDIVSDDQRASSVLQTLRNFLKKADFEFQPLDMVGVVKDVGRMLRREAELREMTLDLQFGPDPPTVRGDRIQLQQVLVNLVVNAIDAMKEARESGTSITVRMDRANGEALRIAVIDSGPGIPPGELERIFEPYVSSKSSGLGMGLAIARSIVQAHGGRLWAENHPGGGAAFVLELPVEGA